MGGYGYRFSVVGSCRSLFLVCVAYFGGCCTHECLFLVFILQVFRLYIAPFVCIVSPVFVRFEQGSCF